MAAIPKYDELTRPMLEILADGQIRHTQQIATLLGDRFKLTDEQRNTLLPSGIQTYLVNRAGWAGFYLQKAGLISRPKRANWQITPAGKSLLQEPPAKLDRVALMRFPEFAAFVKGSAPTSGQAEPEESQPSKEIDSPPDEAIAVAFRSLQRALRDELLATVKKMPAVRFERLVLDLLLAMGYGGNREEAARMTKMSHDEGIDGVINEDRLGLDVIYVQAKRWDSTVGRKEIQSFVGALAGQQANKGIFITTSDFAQTALQFVQKISQRVILVDGDRLSELMVEHNIGVSRSHSYEIKRIDSDYFDEA